jgi:hypothetical protein
MGQEMECTAHVGRRALAGKAMLETDELVFRGDERLRIRLADVKRAKATDDGRLVIRFKGGTVSFELGAAAAGWAARINNPPTRLDKLGVKHGQRVALAGTVDAEFERELETADVSVKRGRPGKGADLVVLGAERIRDLERIAAMEAAIAPDGAVWVVYPKGRADIREADVLGAGRDAGLVDVKVARFSDTHTALKFVIPRAGRADRTAAAAPRRRRASPRGRT